MDSDVAGDMDTGTSGGRQIIFWSLLKGLQALRVLLHEIPSIPSITPTVNGHLSSPLLRSTAMGPQSTILGPNRSPGSCLCLEQTLSLLRLHWKLL